MRWIDRLGTAQRIVLVVALGIAADIVGNYVVNLGSGAEAFGWYAYAPLSQATLIGSPHGLHGWLRVLIWLVLIGLWALAALRLLRPAAGDR